MVLGYCKYCHDRRMVDVPDDATDDEINKAATLDCDCPGAKLARKKEYQREACTEYIEKNDQHGLSGDRRDTKKQYSSHAGYEDQQDNN